MKTIQRNKTEVISVSLPKNVIGKLNELQESEGRTRSGLITWLIKKYEQDKVWREIYAEGGKTAKRLNITSEEDVDRILHED